MQLSLINSPIESLLGNWDSLFWDSPLRNSQTRKPTYYRDTERGGEFQIDLPGVKKADLKISVENGTLHIEALRKTPEGEVKFSRSWSVPQDMDPEKIGAELTDGVLTVILPKLETKKPKAIEVAVK